MLIIQCLQVFYHETMTTTSCVTPNKVKQNFGYRIIVWAIKQGSNSLASKEIELIVPNDFYVNRLTVPTNIKANAGTVSVSLTFSAVTGATSYDILFDGRVYNTTKTTFLTKKFDL